MAAVAGRPWSREIESGIVTSALQTLLDAAPFDSPSEAIWVEPDLVIIDDLHGPAALRLLAEHFGAHTPIARADRIHVVSAIDLENALPDRIRAHEALGEFANHHRLIFTHQIGACEEGCAPMAPRGKGWLIATARKADPAAAANGCVSVSVQPMDLAGLLASARTWVRRPAIQRIDVKGSLRAPATVHDLAIALRPRMSSGAWACIHWPQCPGESQVHSLCALLLGDSPAQNVFAPAEPLGDASSALVVDAARIAPLLGEGEQSRPLSDEEPTDVDRVYIGSCTTGSVADLRLAAEVLVGQRVHVPTVVAPASMRDVLLLRSERLADGGPNLETIFREAGCDLGLPGCAACVNALGDMQRAAGRSERLTVVATAVANVSTRSVARVLTASPPTAAMIALHGRIGGPRVRQLPHAAATVS